MLVTLFPQFSVSFLNSIAKMARERNERRKKLKSFKRKELIELERKVNNMLIECIAGNLDEIIPSGWKKKHICEHCSSPKDKKCKKPKDETSFLARILTATLVKFVLHCMGLPDCFAFVLVLSFTVQRSREEPVFLAVAAFIAAFIVGVCVEQHLKLLL